MESASDEKPEEITGTVVALNTKTAKVEKFNDPFSESGAIIKSFEGVSPSLKRSTTRKLEKAASLVTVEPVAGRRDPYPVTESLTGYDVFQVVLPPYQLEYLAEIYDMSSWYHGAVDALVANTVGLGYHFEHSPRMKYELEKEQSADKIEKMRQKLTRTRAMLDEWIDTLNYEDSLQEILEKAMTDFFTMGNGYIEVGRTVEGNIEYLGHVPASTIRVRRRKDGYVQVIGNQAIFFRNFGDQTTPDRIGNDPQPNELIHLKNYTPKNAYYGVPDVYAAKNAVAGNEYSSQFNLDYFENKAVPRYIISLKNAMLDKAAEARLLEFFEVGLKGTGNSHRSLYVPLRSTNPETQPELKFDAIESGRVDSSFNDYREGNRDEILMSLRVPINKLGLPKGVSLAAGRDASKSFKEERCQPIQRRVEKRINKIFAGKTDALTFTLDQLTLTDEDTRSKIEERLAKIQALTPNEIRESRGMPSVEWGDRPFTPTAQEQAEMKAQGNRERDAVRSAGATDSAGEGRNAQGEGRSAP